MTFGPKIMTFLSIFDQNREKLLIFHQKRDKIVTFCLKKREFRSKFLILSKILKIFGPISIEIDKIVVQNNEIMSWTRKLF